MTKKESNEGKAHKSATKKSSKGVKHISKHAKGENKQSKKDAKRLIYLIIIAIAIPLFIWGTLAIFHHAQEATNASNVELQKDKPTVELFVMAYCPFGTQMEKGILPVIKTLGNKIDFKIKFVYYAMHGKKEVDEELNQYCIQKEYPLRYRDYLSCFLEAGDSKGCIQKLGFNQARLDKCITEADKEYKVSEYYNDKSSWLSGRFPIFPIYLEDNKKYGVGGSPTLVINGKIVRARRDPASLLKTICNAFKEKPKECNAKLSSVTPSPGFGFGASASALSSGGCGA